MVPGACTVASESARTHAPRRAAPTSWRGANLPPYGCFPAATQRGAERIASTECERSTVIVACMSTFNAWMVGGPWDQLGRHLTSDDAADGHLVVRTGDWSGTYVRDAMKPLEWHWHPDDAASPDGSESDPGRG